MIYNPYFQPQIQNSFVMVRSETEAINYPVAFGNSVTFKNETEPFIYTKTMGFSATDKPIFERYRKVEEEVKEETPNDYTGQIIDLKDEITSLWKEIEIMKKGTNNEHTRTRKSVSTKSNEDAVTEV